jgi:predicted DsbA family dithiol-disulfide isomerase
MYDAPVALLEIFIHEGCASEHSARRVAIEIQQEFPAWTISLQQLGNDRAVSLGVIAAPTFVLDGRIVAVGLPRTEWLVRTLREWIDHAP